jgi:hypothetical protein
MESASVTSHAKKVRVGNLILKYVLMSALSQDKMIVYRMEFVTVIPHAPLGKFIDLMTENVLLSVPALEKMIV